MTKKHRGRKRLLTDEQVGEIREAWAQNNNAWQRHRSQPQLHPKPINLSQAILAKRFRVSEGVIANVLDRKGAYAAEIPSKTMIVPRPMPSQAAQRALARVEQMDVTFAEDATEADEDAALAHLNELIDWWAIPSKFWRTRQ